MAKASRSRRIWGRGPNSAANPTAKLWASLGQTGGPLFWRSQMAHDQEAPGFSWGRLHISHASVPLRPWTRVRASSGTPALVVGVRLMTRHRDLAGDRRRTMGAWSQFVYPKRNRNRANKRLGTCVDAPDMRNRITRAGQAGDFQVPCRSEPSAVSVSNSAGEDQRLFQAGSTVWERVSRT